MKQDGIETTMEDFILHVDRDMKTYERGCVRLRQAKVAFALGGGFWLLGMIVEFWRADLLSSLCLLAAGVAAFLLGRELTNQAIAMFESIEPFHGVVRETV